MPKRRLSWGALGFWAGLLLGLGIACGGAAEGDGGDDGKGASGHAAGSDGLGTSGSTVKPGDEHEAGSAGTGQGPGEAGAGGAPLGGECCSGAPAPDAYCQPPAVGVVPEVAEVVPDDVTGRELLVDELGDSYLVGTAPEAPGWYLLKLHAASVVWSRYLGDDSAASFVTLRFAQDGDLLVGVVVDPSKATQQIALFRYDRSGEQVAKHVVAQPNGPEGASDARVQVFDGDDGLEVWGSFSGSWSVAGETLEASSDLDLYRIQVAADGQVTAAGHFARAKQNRLNHGVIDEQGTRYLAIAGMEYSPANTDPMLVAFADDLTPVWERAFEADVVPYRLALSDGKLVVAGMDDSRLFLATLDASTGETLSWADLPEVSVVKSLTLLPDASVVLGGLAPSTTDFGSLDPLDSNYGPGPFLAAFTQLGEHLWSTLYCVDGAAKLEAVGYGGGALKGLLSYDGAVELGEVDLFQGSSALLSLPDATGAGGAGGGGGG